MEGELTAPPYKWRASGCGPGAFFVPSFVSNCTSIGKGATATLLVDEKEVAQSKIPQTVGVRFSLDETFDIGQDTGTPVLEEYESRMPFAFTGTLKKFVVVLQPENLSDDERRRLHEELAKALMAVQ